MAAMQRRTRLILLSVVLTVAALLLAAVIGLYVLLQPQRITDLLRHQAQRIGLTLSLNAPAEPTLWPQPALVLHGLTLSADNRPVLVAARARVELPWDTLFGGPVAITQLELDTLQLDVARLGDVLGNLKSETAGTPQLPHINAGIRIDHGTLTQNGTVLLDHMHMETGPLLPEQAFNLQLTANANDKPFTLTLRTTPQPTPDALKFADTHITYKTSSGAHAVLDGEADWRGGNNIRLTLHGNITDNDNRRYTTQLQLIPGRQSFVCHLIARGPGMNARLHLPTSEMVAWWHEVSNPALKGPLPLPPMDGVIEAEQLDAGSVHMEGLRMTAGAAAASSTPAAASSAPATP